jgi:hypothetical protein
MKLSSLLGRFLSYKENEVLLIWHQGFLDDGYLAGEDRKLLLRLRFVIRRIFRLWRMIKILFSVVIDNKLERLVFSRIHRLV